MDFAALWPIFVLSVQVSGLAVLLSAAIGIPAGVWLGMTRSRCRKPLRLLVHTGMALPPVVVGLVLYLLLSRSGPLAALGWLFTPSAMILAQTILALPFVIGITAASVAAVPGELLIQLRSLGASGSQLRATVVREAKSGIWLAVAAAFGRSISEVGAVLIVGGNIEGHTRVLTTAIVLETGKGEFAFALSLAAVLLFLALVVNFLMLRFQGRQPAV